MRPIQWIDAGYEHSPDSGYGAKLLSVEIGNGYEIVPVGFYVRADYGMSYYDDSSNAWVEAPDWVISGSSSIFRRPKTPKHQAAPENEGDALLKFFGTKVGSWRGFLSEEDK